MKDKRRPQLKVARSTCFEKSRLLLDLMVDARFDPTIKYDSSDSDDGVDHDDDHHQGCRDDNIQGSNNSK